MESITIHVTMEYHISQARLAARSLAERSGFGTNDIFAICTSVSELATNLFLHTANGGIIMFNAVDKYDTIGLEIRSEDKGPGISNLDLAMEDGYSTAGGLGSGLPGVQRLMDEFEITSIPGIGTRVTARKWKRKP